MQVLYPRCAGLDVHKKTVVACILHTQPDGKVHRVIRTFSTMTVQLLALGAWLDEQEVTHVAMESTGIYWRPVYTVLEADTRTLIVVNAQHIMALPGRQKTDVKDCEWIADLLRHGLLPPSFIPPRPIRALRDLTRYRKELVGQYTQQINRLHKTLESANIKLSSVATDIVGASGRRMLRAIQAGEEDALVLAELAKGSLRGKIPQLRLALEGRVLPFHRILIGQILDFLAYLDQALAHLDAAITAELDPYASSVQFLQTIPGIGPVSLAAILAEIGEDMSRFPSAHHLASWAGLCPGNKVSAGKRLSGRTRKGNKYLRTILCEVAWTCTHMPDTYLYTLYQRIARRRGKNRAILAVAHSLLVIIYQMLLKQIPYQELGAGYYDQREKTNLERHHVRRLQQLGFEVQLTPHAS